MYTNDKGENIFEESEILEPLHTCLRELLERDNSKKSHLIKYTDTDVVAATLLYTHILGNRLSHEFGQANIDERLATRLASSFGEHIRVTTKQMSGVDLGTYYRDKGKG